MPELTLSQPYGYRTIFVGPGDPEEDPNYEMAEMLQATPPSGFRIFPEHSWGTARLTVQLEDGPPAALTGDWDAVQEVTVPVGGTWCVMSSGSNEFHEVEVDSVGPVRVRVAGRNRFVNVEEGAPPDPDEEYLIQVWSTGEPPVDIPVRGPEEYAPPDPGLVSTAPVPPGEGTW